MLLFAPVGAATWDVDASAVPWIAASAALEIVCFVSLRLPAARVELGWATLAAAICAFAAYTLVLGALTLASAPSVAAVRETGVLFAVALDASVLGEPFGCSRASGAVLLVAGVALEPSKRPAGGRDLGATRICARTSRCCGDRVLS